MTQEVQFDREMYPRVELQEEPMLVDIMPGAKNGGLELSSAPEQAELLGRWTGSRW